MRRECSIGSNQNVDKIFGREASCDVNLVNFVQRKAHSCCKQDEMDDMNRVLGKFRLS